MAEDDAMRVLDMVRTWPDTRPPTTLQVSYALAWTKTRTRLAVEHLKRVGIVSEVPWWPDEGLVLRARRPG